MTRRHRAVYLDEVVFRHNRRLNLSAPFQALLGLGTGRGSTTYDTITGAKDLPMVPFTPSREVAAAAGATAMDDTSEALRESSEEGAGRTPARGTWG